MANKTSRSSRSNRNSRNNGRAQKNSGSSNWFSRFGSRNLAILAIFVVGFGGLGIWYLNKSQASTPCIYQYVGWGSYGWCVTEVQNGLQAMTSYGVYGASWPGRVDGIYGKDTHGAIWDFQHYYIGQDNPSGTIIALQNGGKTWSPFCRRLGSVPRTQAHNAWLGLSCDWISG
ncbi:MAG TPA: hypothetical protein VLG47_05410 [Candidatus Saccharimonadales bacterium]|nr:hypothetical protein [Candidatus Saccharimonadales bacterium]